MSRRNKAQWRELILQQQSSGLSAAEFCCRESINPKYFNMRKGLLAVVRVRRFVRSGARLSLDN